MGVPTATETYAAQCRGGVDMSDGPQDFVPPTISDRLLVSCERWKACISKWEDLTTRGLKNANKLVNVLLSKKIVMGETMGSLARLGDISEAYDNHIFQQTGVLFPKLRANFDQLSSTYSQMQGIHKNLETARGKNYEFRDSVVVLGVTTSDLVEASGRLLASYERELRVREAIVRGLSTEEPHRRTYMLYLTTWATEPYVSGQSKDRFYVRSVVELLKQT